LHQKIAFIAMSIWLAATILSER